MSGRELIREEAKQLALKNIQWFFNYFTEVEINIRDLGKKLYSQKNSIEIVLTVRKVNLDKEKLDVLSKRDDCAVFQGDLEYIEEVFYGKKV